LGERELERSRYPLHLDDIHGRRDGWGVEGGKPTSRTAALSAIAWEPGRRPTRSAQAGAPPDEVVFALNALKRARGIEAAATGATG
jgi:hypothetical protein